MDTRIWNYRPHGSEIDKLMSVFIDFPLVGTLNKRITMSRDGLKILLDKEDNVFVTDETGADATYYEVDMRYDKVQNLLNHKSFLAKGRRRLKENTLLSLKQNDVSSDRSG